MASVYAVRAGRRPGVYQTWAECEPQVSGVRGAQFRRFASRDEATAWVETGCVRRAPEPRADAQPARFLPTEADGNYRVWVDGACPANGTASAVRGGIGVWWGCHEHPRNISRVVTPGDNEETDAVTNQLCELMALEAAMQQAVELRQAGLLRTVCIYTDSTYALHAVTKWVDGWRRRAWVKTDGTPVRHRRRMENLQALRDQLGDALSIHHVRGHSGDVGNIAADALAVQAARGAEVKCGDRRR